MFGFLSALVICFTLYLIAGQALTALVNLRIRPTLVISLSPQPQQEPAPSDTPSTPQPSKDVLLFIAQENSDFAREQLLSEAHQLYLQYGDWSAVLTDLRRLFATVEV